MPKGIKGFQKGHKYFGGKPPKGIIPWNKGRKCTEEEKKQLKKQGFQKGMVTWNAGKKGCFSKETIKKMSLAKIGKTPSNIQDLQRFGEKHWNWKGGITPDRVKERNSLEYKEWRKLVFMRDYYTCNNCKQHGVKLVVHHIKEKSKHPELTLDINNGITLCEDCHKEIHFPEKERILLEV